MSSVDSAQVASIGVVEEEDATGKVATTYEEIRSTLGIDFVPNMYRALAVNPDQLEMTWRNIQSLMGEEGNLGRKTKDIVALTVSIMSGCDYCIEVYNEAVREDGLDDSALLELYEVIDLYTGLTDSTLVCRQRRMRSLGMVAGGAN